MYYITSGKQLCDNVENCLSGLSIFSAIFLSISTESFYSTSIVCSVLSHTISLLYYIYFNISMYSVTNTVSDCTMDDPEQQIIYNAAIQLGLINWNMHPYHMYKKNKEFKGFAAVLKQRLPDLLHPHFDLIQTSRFRDSCHNAPPQENRAFPLLFKAD